jgi:predicted XRE-type DNA-binding protein
MAGGGEIVSVSKATETGISVMVKLKITKSSGNVFADIGFAAGEAANLQLRASLMTRLTKLVNGGEFAPQAAAKLFGVTQPRLNLLLRGRIDEFSVSALVNMFACAGFTVKPRIVKTSVFRAKALAH